MSDRVKQLPVVTWEKAAKDLADDHWNKQQLTTAEKMWMWAWRNPAERGKRPMTYGDIANKLHEMFGRAIHRATVSDAYRREVEGMFEWEDGKVTPKEGSNE